MGRNGPNVTWVGLIVRTDDGQVHAVELHGGKGNLVADGNFVTVDLIIDQQYASDDPEDKWISAVIRGRGRFWSEGANMGPTAQPRVNRQIEAQRQHAIDNNLIIEG